MIALISQSCHQAGAPFKTRLIDDEQKKILTIILI
jgi:hypothetical protein